MKLIDFIKDGGLCKSKSGHWFKLTGFDDSEYPIIGCLSINGRQYQYKWNEDGTPHNLPYTHGLDLMPVVKEVSYRMVNKSILNECECLGDFYNVTKNCE